MGKLAKPKQRGATSTHSRAARRATSPSIDVDKSIKEAKADKDNGGMFSGAHNAGISKKKKTKNMTRQQRLRHEKGLERAEGNMDKHITKVQKSKQRARAVDERRAAWEDTNVKAVKAVPRVKEDDSDEDKTAPKTKKSKANASVEVVETLSDVPAGEDTTAQQSSADVAEDEWVDEVL